NTRGPLLVKMLEEAKAIDFRKTDSVLEALLLEADLIKKFKPPYNTQEKDDKSFNCIVLTKEDFPKLLVMRKKDVELDMNRFKKVFGPFTNGYQLKEALKLVRRIFPYRDEKCSLPGEQKLKAGQLPRPCFNYTIGLCPGTCIGAIDKHCYAIRIRRIEKLLSGDVKAVLRDLTKDMNNLAKERKFEAARILRDKIYGLQHINDISLIKNDLVGPNAYGHEPSFRIEAYDIAHMSGQNMVGVMTVVEDGMPNKSQYRKFKINTVTSSNDPKALKEVLERRFEHTEWSFPNLVVVDGSTAQLNAANDVMLAKGLKIPVAAVVKDNRHKAKGVLGREDLVKKHKRAIVLANAESHRFAIAFHKKRRMKNFLPEI
ncbi:MAG TPA: hypothetical protein VEC13_03150, partial [Candidatus Paceibacterota bacterium]|nr:hypothetical protein [Candidatus Paceibacterota bacterium]